MAPMPGWYGWAHAWDTGQAVDLGCVGLGNLDLDFKIRISDLQSNAKSEKGFQRWDHAEIHDLFFDFHFYRSIGKSEKGFVKLSLRTAVLRANASLTKRTPLFTRTVLQILFRISQSNGKEIQNYPAVKSHAFSDFVFDRKIRNPHFNI